MKNRLLTILLFFLFCVPDFVRGSEITIFGNQTYTGSASHEQAKPQAPPPLRWDLKEFFSTPAPSAGTRTEVMMGLDPADRSKISLNDLYDIQTYLTDEDKIENLDLLNKNAVFIADWGSYADKAGMSRIWDMKKRPVRIDAGNITEDIKEIIFLTTLPKGIKAAFKKIAPSAQEAILSGKFIATAPYKDYDEDDYQDQDEIKEEDQDKGPIMGIELDSTTIIILCVALFGIAVIGRKIPF